MDQSPLVNEETEAGAEFVEQFDKKMPVKVAFWLKPSAAGQWYLYIASDQIDEQSLDRGYREVLRLANQSPSPYLEPLRVKLIPSSDPLALAALEFHRRFPYRGPTRLGRRLELETFGGSSVDGVFLYPAPDIAPAS